jgi:hypothetical protein
MSILQDFTQGRWQVHYSQGSIYNEEKGQTFEINLPEPTLAAQLNKEIVVRFLDQIADKTFFKAEYHTDGKLYLYNRSGEDPAVFDITKLEGAPSSHRPIFQIYRSEARQLADAIPLPIRSQVAAEVNGLASSLLSKLAEAKNKIKTEGDIEAAKFLEEGISEIIMDFPDEKIAPLSRDLASQISKLFISFASTQMKTFDQLEIYIGRINNFAQMVGKTIKKTQDIHPLYYFDKAIAEQRAKQPKPIWGAYFSGFNTKGGHVHASRNIINGKEWNCIDFKIPIPIRNKLQEGLLKILANPQAFNQALPPGLCESATVTSSTQAFRKRDDNVFTDKDRLLLPNGTIEFDFKGLGRVIIGNDPNSRCLYNWVNVEMAADLPPGEGILKLNQMLTLIGIGPLDKDPQVDEKIKIAQLTRAFYPALITAMAGQEEFYQLTPDELKKRICEAKPQMGSIFDKYLAKMRKEAIFPVKSVWVVPDLANSVRDQGAWGLMAGMGKNEPFEDVCGYLVRRLKEGTISSMDRFAAGWIKHGASSIRDLNSGGGDQVFLRMIGKELEMTEIQQFVFSGTMQVLYDLSILNRGAYAYYEDKFGAKGIPLYENRSDLLTFAKNLRGHHHNNEVMIKNRIPPEYIIGAVVSSVKQKRKLIETLRKAGVVVNDKINGVPVEEFVHIRAIDQPFEKTMWRRK